MIYIYIYIYLFDYVHIYVLCRYSYFGLHECAHKENVSIDDVVSWTWNRFNKDEKILFISDPPHLIKTLQNNIKNSHGYHNTWQLIVSVFSLLYYLFSYCITSAFYCIILFKWPKECVLRLLQPSKFFGC